MSGIFGLIGAPAQTLDSTQSDKVLRGVADALRHRGADEVGFHNGRHAALGCCLLKTAGADEAGQPFAAAGGKVHILLDGAIYNGNGLRADLRRSGHDFHTVGDAELIVTMYMDQGVDFVKRLRGHFAIAICDERNPADPILVLTRDHLGQKPLFYNRQNGGVLFASEVKGLLAVRQQSARLDVDSLDRYLSMRFIAGSGTMIEGVKKVPPATILVYRDGKIQETRYWQLSFATKLRMTERDYIDAVEEKFAETVAVQVAEHEKTGAFLSGGLDSSLIVAMMARKLGRGVPTFSIGFAEKEFNEIEFARIVSEQFGTQQHEATADTDLLKTLPSMIRGLDEPSDPVAASFYSASKLAANHVKISLGGDGGNELFAGSDRYRGVLLAKYYALLPGPIRTPLVNGLANLIPASFGYESLGMKLRWMERMAGTSGLGERLAEAVAFFRFNPDEKLQLLGSEHAKKLDLRAAAADISDRFYESDAEHPIEKMLYTDFSTRLPEHLLMLVDRMGMTHGLEVRSPMVDKELVEFMAQIPLEMKVKGQKARYIEYRLADKLLPASIARRKKRGFRFPLAAWFAVELYSFVRAVFAQSRLVEHGILNGHYMLQILEEHRSRRIDHNWRIWMLLNLEIWYRLYIDGNSMSDTEAWISDIL